MPDSHQTGAIATLHQFAQLKLNRIEEDLVDFSTHRPIALLLPVICNELDDPAFWRAAEGLADVPYLDEIVVSLGQADSRQFDFACSVFSGLPQKTTILWNDGPLISALRKSVEDIGLHIGPAGKSQCLWLGCGLILAGHRTQVIAVHDSDIYSRESLARLVYPIVNPNLSFDFCKGYYAKDEERMYGRLNRLLVTPLLRTLRDVLQPHPLLDYLDSFRYPLAGAFSMKAELARTHRIPCDGGLEIGLLSEVCRSTSVKRICQVELCETHDLKGQDLGYQLSDKRMFSISVDIAKNVLHMLAAEGATISPAHINTVLVRYQKLAEDAIDRYHADAQINGAPFGRHREETLVEMFHRAICLAAEKFHSDPLGVVRMSPNWNRVLSVLPGFIGDLESAARRDNESARLVAVI